MSKLSHDKPLPAAVQLNQFRGIRIIENRIADGTIRPDNPGRSHYPTTRARQVIDYVRGRLAVTNLALVKSLCRTTGDYDGEYYSAVLLTYARCLKIYNPDNETGAKFSSYVTAAIKNTLYSTRYKEQRWCRYHPSKLGEQAAEIAAEITTDRDDHIDGLDGYVPILLHILNKRERYVITHHILRGRTLTYVGGKLGVSKQAIAVTRNKALKRMREYLEHILN